MTTAGKKDLKSQGFELVYSTANIAISFHQQYNVIYADWIGIQEEDALKNAGQKIIELLELKKCSKVLNDNTRVIGHWYHSVDWTNSNWFPHIMAAGLKHFAWVCSEDVFTQLSAKRAIPPGNNVVRAFATFEEGLDWLKHQMN